MKRFKFIIYNSIHVATLLGLFNIVNEKLHLKLRNEIEIEKLVCNNNNNNKINCLRNLYAGQNKKKICK